MATIASQFYKTKLCPWWSRGTCSKKDKCHFAHGADDLRSSPNLQRTRMCHFIMRDGFCPEGDRCNFSHTLSGLRATEGFWKTKICPLQLRGKCLAGENCRFAHTVDELRPRNTSAPASAKKATDGNTTNSFRESNKEKQKTKVDGKKLPRPPPPYHNIMDLQNLSPMLANIYKSSCEVCPPPPYCGKTDDKSDDTSNNLSLSPAMSHMSTFPFSSYNSNGAWIVPSNSPRSSSSSNVASDFCYPLLSPPMGQRQLAFGFPLCPDVSNSPFLQFSPQHGGITWSPPSHGIQWSPQQGPVSWSPQMAAATRNGVSWSPQIAAATRNPVAWSPQMAAATRNLWSPQFSPQRHAILLSPQVSPSQLSQDSPTAVATVFGSAEMTNEQHVDMLPPAPAFSGDLLLPKSAAAQIGPPLNDLPAPPPSPTSHKHRIKIPCPPLSPMSSPSITVLSPSETVLMCSPPQEPKSSVSSSPRVEGGSCAAESCSAATATNSVTNGSSMGNIVWPPISEETLKAAMPPCYAE